MRQSLAGRLVRKIVGWRGSIVAPLSKGWQREREIIAETRARTQMLLTDAAALHILICARAARALPGAFAEAGVYKGGSARLLCEEKADAALHLFDVFEALQSGAVAGADAVREHFKSIYGQESAVRELLHPYPNVHFHPGFFPRRRAVSSNCASRSCTSISTSPRRWRRRSSSSTRGWCRAGFSSRTIIAIWR